MEQVTRMNTGVVRASYLNVTTPRASEDGGDPKYSVALLIPKSDTRTVADIRSCIAAAIAVDKDGKGNLKGVTTPKNPLHDGDGERPNGGAYGDEAKGCWVLNASSKSKPGLVDSVGQLMADPAEWYSGIYIRANINFYSYNARGNKGIACGLNHLQKRRDGEPLSGAGNPSDAFNDGFADDESVLD